jgi:hypothetical protein
MGKEGAVEICSGGASVGFVMQKYGSREESMGEKREEVRRLRENGGKRGRCGGQWGPLNS